MKFFEILKKICIVLLCLFGIAIQIIPLFLFVPIKYTIRAKGQDKDIGGQAVVSWLFGIIKAGVLYTEGGLTYKISVMEIPIKKGTLGKKDKQSKKETKAAIKKLEREENPDKKKEEKETEIKESDVLKEPATNETYCKEKEDKSGKNKKSFKLKFSEFWTKLQKTVNKVNDYKDKALKIKRALETKTGQRAIAFVKCQIINFLRIIKPRYIKGFVKYGTDNPAITAEIYGFAAQASYLISKDQLMVVPDFDNKCLEMDLTVTGKFHVYRIVIIIINVLLNKDFNTIKNEIGRITNGGQN